MARQLRVEFPGAIYHVSVRMVGDAAAGGTGWPPDKCLFRDDKDRERFIDALGERVQQYNIRLYLFVCMTNHLHLVFEAPEANCSKFMQSLTTAYTVYYNKRHRRHGHLVDGRYKAKLVDENDYLLELSRYVHLNPEHVGTQKRKPIEDRIRHLRGYKWSTYPSYIRKGKGYDFVEYGPILSQMSGRKQSEWPKLYREYVETGLADNGDDFQVAMKLSPRSIGSDDFRAWIDDFYQKQVEGHARPEDVSFRHITEPLGADEVLSVLAEAFGVEPDAFRRRRRNSPLRGVAARYLIRYAAQSQRDVADYLNAGSGSAISKQLSGLADKLTDDRKLRRLLKQLDIQLAELYDKHVSKGQENSD
jgi:putative transposase